ncbi:MAG: fasciclin domain-containing protein, partial [Bacteroidota bacterium]
VHSAGVVLNILARHREPPPPLTISTPDALKLAREPAADCDFKPIYFNMKYLRTQSLAVVAALLIMACGQKKEEQAEEVVEEVVEEVQETAEEVIEEATTGSIVEVAMGNQEFSTLVTAVTAADLVETLSGEGPFTVFAPTNGAFAKLPEGTLGSLLKAESKPTLTGILTYHVVAGKFEAAQVIEAINSNNGTFTITTVQGDNIDLSLQDGNVVLTDITGGKATVIIPDVAASNGVIHAIDSVVLPE